MRTNAISPASSFFGRGVVWNGAFVLETAAVLGFSLGGLSLSTLLLRWLGPESTGVVDWLTVLTLS